MTRWGTEAGASTERALNHIRVLEFGESLSVQYGGRLLAGFGADVVKVEPPGGGAARRRWRTSGIRGPVREHPVFAFLNQGKRSVVVDASDPAALTALVQPLITRADIVMCTPDSLATLGDLVDGPEGSPVVCCISDFGLSGPYARFQANELILQAASGLMCLIGHENAPPVREAFSQAQIMAGITGALAAMTGIHGRRISGEADLIDVSVLECVASGLQASLMYYSFMGGVRARSSSDRGGLGQITPTSNGYVIPMLGGYGHWDALVAFFDDPALADERFQNHSGRLRYGDELAEIILRALERRDKFEVFHAGQEWGFPFGVVQEPDDLLQCPQLGSRSFWSRPGSGPLAGLKVPGAPFRLSATPWAGESPAPSVGQHTREVLQSVMGLPDETLDSLDLAGVTS